jgi:hypothetical protein
VSATLACWTMCGCCAGWTAPSPTGGCWCWCWCWCWRGLLAAPLVQLVKLVLVLGGLWWPGPCLPPAACGLQLGAGGCRPSRPSCLAGCAHLLGWAATVIPVAGRAVVSGGKGSALPAPRLAPPPPFTRTRTRRPPLVRAGGRRSRCGPPPRRALATPSRCPARGWLPLGAAWSRAASSAWRAATCRRASCGCWTWIASPGPRWAGGAGGGGASGVVWRWCVCVGGGGSGAGGRAAGRGAAGLEHLCWRRGRRLASSQCRRALGPCSPRSQARRATHPRPPHCALPHHMPYHTRLITHATLHTPCPIPCPTLRAPPPRWTWSRAQPSACATR